VTPLAHAGIAAVAVVDGAGPGLRAAFRPLAPPVRPAACRLS
jgi:hypothetical protein